MNCRVCGIEVNKVVMEFHEPDGMELSMGVTPDGYMRRYYECEKCGCFSSDLDHHAPLSDAFNKNYYEHVDGETISGKFERVMAMGADQSDNWHRVERVLSTVDRLRESFSLVKGNQLLDVGSGTGVFLGHMKRVRPEFQGIALEPDEKACEHLEEVLEAKVVCDVLRPGLFSAEFDILTFNRVMEHLPDPLDVLNLGLKSLKKGGMVYIEVPDTLTHSIYGSTHPEFGSAHLTIYHSLGLEEMLSRAGFAVLEKMRVREPSGKLTLFAMATRVEDLY